MRRAVAVAAGRLWGGRAEALLAGAILLGWAALTAGLARIGAAPIVWRLSLGLLLLSACGWRFLVVLARDGLYALTRARGGRRG